MRPIEQFSGLPADNYQVQEFLEDLDHYLKTTGKNSPAFIEVDGKMEPNPSYGQVEKEVLRASLRGPAKLWFRQLPPSTSYTSCIESLKNRFRVTTHQKHVKRMEIFQMVQGPTETYLEYISRVLDASHNLNIEEDDIVTIVTQGAHPSLRVHLIMNNPKTIEALMKLPLVRSEKLANQQNAEFVNALTTWQQ